MEGFGLIAIFLIIVYLLDCKDDMKALERRNREDEECAKRHRERLQMLENFNEEREVKERASNQVINDYY